MRLAVFIIPVFIFLLYGFPGTAQLKTTAQGFIEFEGSYTIPEFRFYRDTIANPNNIWQVASPQKIILNAADSPPNVVITDSVNSYPVNDTSSFILWQTAGQGLADHYSAKLHGWYWVNSDSLTDYGKIEISIDHGNNWIDILTDTSYNFFTFSPVPKPELTGNSFGWIHIFIDLTPFSDSMDVQFGDTILMRFSFISDGIQTNKDGLMFDGFFMEDWSVNAITNLSGKGIKQLEAFPNPAQQTVSVKIPSQFYDSNIDVLLFDQYGKLVMKAKLKSGNEISLNINGLPPGNYFFSLKTAKSIIGSGRFVK
jgi:hypothetical protein